MKKILLAIILMSSLVSINAAMAGSSSGLVSTIYVIEGDIVVFKSGPHQQPSCSSIGDESWAFSLTTSAGKAMYALLLTASSQSKPVTVIGNNLCNSTSLNDRESPYYINVVE